MYFPNKGPISASVMSFKFIFKTFCINGLISLVIFGIMHLWNWLIPTLFKGPVITYWQTLGLIVLSKIFLSGFGHGGGHPHHRHNQDCERPVREDWWKKFNEMRKGREKNSPVE